jgi:hypothetical protein
MNKIKIAIYIPIVFVSLSGLWFILSAKGYLTGINIFLINAFHSQSENLEFSFKKHEDKCQPLFDAYIKNIDWRKPDQLHCEILIPANCGDYFWTGDFKFKNNNTIILELNSYQREFLACGACPIDLEYVIHGLKQQDYHILLDYGGRTFELQSAMDQ